MRIGERPRGQGLRVLFALVRHAWTDASSLGLAGATCGDVIWVRAQNSRLRPHLPAAPAVASPLGCRAEPAFSGSLVVSMPLTHACAHSWAGRVLRSSREPGLRVPDGSRRGAGAGLPAEEVRPGPGQAGRPGSGCWSQGAPVGLPGSVHRDSPGPRPARIPDKAAEEAQSPAASTARAPLAPRAPPIPRGLQPRRGAAGSRGLTASVLQPRGGPLDDCHGILLRDSRRAAKCVC